MAKRMIIQMLVALIFFLAASFEVKAQEKKLNVTGESEAQINQDGEKLSFSQFLYEEYGRFSFVQRWYPSEGRMPRYEIGGGPVFRSKKGKGPFTEVALKLRAGWCAEGSQYITTGANLSFKAFGHPVTLSVDRKNLLVGQKRGTFEFQKVRVNLWKFVWARWEGNFKEPPHSSAHGITWNSSQPGLEVQVPIGKRYKPFATWQYDTPSGKWLSHFGFRF